MAKLMDKQEFHTVIVALGSNHDAYNNIDNATRLLVDILNDTIESTAIETLPIGMCNGAMFVNKIIVGKTTLSCDHMERALKRFEAECGETRQGRKKGIVVVDMDILKYDDVRYHKTDWDKEYIIRLLAEINLRANAKNQ